MCRRTHFYQVLGMVCLLIGVAMGGAVKAQSLDTILERHDPKADSGSESALRSLLPEGAKDIEGQIKEIEQIIKALDDLAKMLEKLAVAVKEADIKAPDQTQAADAPPAAADEQSSPSRSSSYTVVSGDSLSKIAGKLLGSMSRWPELVEANKAKYPSLAKNPNLIHPGWVLTIPGGTSTSDTATPPPASSGNPPDTATNPPPSSAGTGETAALNAWKGGKLSPQKFAELLGPVARESSKITGIPASVTLAQAALETGWGGSTIGDAKNLFGIKGTGPAGSITVSTQEYIGGRYVTIRDSFRKYNTWRESIDDHGRLISQKDRYRNCMRYKDNPDRFAEELQKAGYATDPRYAAKLINIMKTYNLYQYDV